MSAAFRHELRIRYLECDPQGVVGHPQYLALFDVAMTEMWRQSIGAYGDMVASGTDLMVVESRIRYSSSARFDDVLAIDVSVRKLGTSSIVFGFEATVDGRAICEAANAYVCVRTGTSDKVAIPDEIRTALRPLVADGAEQRVGDR